MRNLASKSLVAASLAAPLVVATALVAGCNGSSPATAADMSGANADLVPLVCNGAFSNNINGTFRPCTIEVANTASDQSMTIKPTGYMPLPGQPMPSMVLFDLVASPQFKAQKYTLDSFADGTQMKLQASSNLANFIAQRTVDDMTQKRTITGSITLTITSPPKQPPGMDAWLDTDVHGSLVANLPLDPNSPGRPGDSVDVIMEF